uniref:Uncharacterized protein n=1 Tax=Candidozyma auris TaxID=498019 RepID=A0A0L0NSP7_CANAR
MEQTTKGIKQASQGKPKDLFQNSIMGEVNKGRT